MFHDESFGRRLLNCQTSLDISCLCYRQDKEAIMEKWGDQSGLFNPREAQFHFLTSKSLNRTTWTQTPNLEPTEGFSPAFPASEVSLTLTHAGFTGRPSCVNKWGKKSVQLICVTPVSGGSLLIPIVSSCLCSAAPKSCSSGSEWRK